MLSRSSLQRRCPRLTRAADADTRHAKRCRAEIARAYLITASVAAAAIDGLSAVAVLGFDVPENTFETTGFRALSIGLVIAIVLATRGAASVAFRSALRERYAVRSPLTNPPVSVSQACPARSLVMLYLAFTGMRHALAEHADS